MGCRRSVREFGVGLYFGGESGSDMEFSCAAAASEAEVEWMACRLSK
jgi:hypothetical protein